MGDKVCRTCTCVAPEFGRGEQYALAAPQPFPLSGVDLIALESKFQTICCKRSGSPETRKDDGEESRSPARKSITVSN